MLCNLLRLQQPLKMRSILLSSTVLVLCLSGVLVSCQQDLTRWSGEQAVRDLLRSMLMEVEDDYEAPASSSKTSSSSSFHGRQKGGPSSMKDKRVAMGVDLPDYIMNYRGKSPDLGAFRDRMLLSGRR
ncbi:hypothetical protein JTE90_001468 [Oedothorax gibbosus]|uniref:Uncharacterized protein n=1 Tax=Oedothorax gibbosus TaxID=931172 RepID=A0AAV6UDJ3_9ARAC|nr:hypothetical protein JTE90_001468 [Oedothorax gibbosus]